MTKRILIGMLALCALIYTGCEPLESGGAPTFTGQPSARAVGPTQIEVRWAAGQDDIGDGTYAVSDELEYVIWIVSGSNTIDPSNDFNFFTLEGARSFNISGRMPDSPYKILVRARDRGAQASENTETIEVRTSATGTGTYGGEISRSLTTTPAGITTGNLLSDPVEAVGLFSTNKITWFSPDNDGVFDTMPNRELTVGSTTQTETITEARMFRLRSGDLVDDLLVLTGSNLYYYNNDANQFAAATTPFGTVPKAGTLGIHEPAEGSAVIWFVDAAGSEQIYTLDDDGMFESQSVDFTIDSAGEFALAHLDEDEFLDLMIFDRNSLRVAMGRDMFLFDSPQVLDETLTRTSERKFLYGDGNGDGRVDLYIFVRNAPARETKLYIFEGDGMGGFAARTEIDFDGALYTKPGLRNGSGDGADDLYFTQSVSNNMVVYTGGTGHFAGTPDFYGGGADFAEFAAFARFDNKVKGRLDIALVTTTSSRSSPKLIAMLAISAATAK